MTNFRSVNCTKQAATRLDPLHEKFFFFFVDDVGEKKIKTRKKEARERRREKKCHKYLNKLFMNAVLDERKLIFVHLVIKRRRVEVER